MKDQTTKQASASQKPNILVRLLALLVTAALALGALTLVVYRDQFNLDAVKRWLALRSVETDASGRRRPLHPRGGDSISFAYLKGGILQCSAGRRPLLLLLRATSTPRRSPPSASRPVRLLLRRRGL